MKVTTCTTASGTYATVRDAGVESTVRLPNGTKRIVSDLEDLATGEESKAKAAKRRADRLRAAVAHLNAGAVAEVET